MAGHYFMQALFVIAGMISFLASLFNWGWFFESHNSQFIIRKLGRKRARMAYGLLGIVLMGAAVFFFLQI